MVHHLIEPESQSPAAAVRALAKRAHRLTRRSADGSAERECRALLHQIAQLRHHLRSPVRTDLHRWLERLQQQVEDLLVQLRWRSTSSHHGHCVSACQR